jgi:acetyl-CoA synthetase
VINVSGHRMGTAEVESALVAHAKVAEAAVVGYPHAIKGQGIYCLCHADERDRARPTSCGRNSRSGSATEIGPIAKPDLIQWAPGLPKTRSGKIMRRDPAQDRRERLRRLGTPRRWPNRRWSTT